LPALPESNLAAIAIVDEIAAWVCCNYSISILDIAREKLIDRRHSQEHLCSVGWSLNFLPTLQGKWPMAILNDFTTSRHQQDLQESGINQIPRRLDTIA
jgi:hypothetical protein